MQFLLVLFLACALLLSAVYTPLVFKLCLFLVAFLFLGLKRAFHAP